MGILADTLSRMVADYKQVSDKLDEKIAEDLARANKIISDWKEEEAEDDE